MHRSPWSLAVPLALLTACGHAQTIRVGPFLQDASPTSIWVGWETTSDPQSIVEFGLAPDALTLSATGSAIPSQGSAQIHHAQLTGLSPDTAYYYRVRTGQAVSAVFRFRTPPLPTDEKPFRFVAYSDTQAGPFSNKHTEVINDGVIAFVRGNFGPNIEDELAFSIEPGDLVDAGSVYDQWKTQFFDEEQNLLQHIPIYPVPGNHEQDAHWFFDYFKLPENGSPGFLEHWWFKDHGNLRIIGIDSNYQVPQQLAWLDGVLADAAANDQIDFVFAQMHHPHKTEPWTPGNTPYIGGVVSRLEAFSTASGKPSIHFFGHTHAYERGQSRDHTHLWVDVSAAEGDLAWWGEYAREDYPEIQKSLMDWGFVLVEVEAGDDPQFRLRRISRGNQFDPKDNEVVDDLTIRVANQGPLQPVPLEPAHGATGIAADAALLRAGAMDDPEGGFHAESHFQLTTTAGDYSAPIDHWIRFENWFAPPDATGRANGYYSVNTVTDPDVTKVTVGGLDEFTTYHWRVRYRDAGLAWSVWSEERSFTTGALPTGACCLPDGDCERLTEAACIAASGTWLGLDTDCDCPPVVVLLDESFEGIPLGPGVDEPTPGQAVWADAPPPGWGVDRSAMPAGGVTEWRGWNFANRDWWVQAAGNQDRASFTRAAGAVAVADPDEWDDAAHAAGEFNSTLTSPAIDLSTVAPNSVRLVMDSSFRPFDDMTGLIEVSFDGGASFDTLLSLTTAGTPGGASSLERANELLVLPIDNPSDGTMMLRFSLLHAGNDWWWAIDTIRVIGAPRGARRTLLHEGFDAMPLGPFVSPSESGGDGTDWTSALPAGWSRDNASTPAAGPAEFFGFTLLDEAAWVATAGDQARSSFTRGERTIMVADPDEYDDLGDIDPDRFNVLVRTPTVPLDGVRAGSVQLEFDSSFRPYDGMTGTVEVSFDNGATFQTLLVLDTPSAGGNSSLSRANERVVLPVPNPLGGGAIVRFALANAGNDWWWAIDDILITGECAADLAQPFGAIDINDFFAFLSLYQLADTRADLVSDGLLNTNDFFAFLAAYQSDCA